MLLLDSSSGTSRSLDNSRHDPTFPTNQVRRSGGHNFTANGCCAGGSLAFRRAIERALACDPRRSTGRAKGSGVPRRVVQLEMPRETRIVWNEGEPVEAIVTAAKKEGVD